MYRINNYVFILKDKMCNLNTFGLLTIAHETFKTSFLYFYSIF